MTTKQFASVEVKDATKGTVEALFSRFNVIDHDGDVTMPDALTDGQKVRISAFNHGSWGGALPVGKGHIEITDDGAVLKGQFFMDTAHGRDTFATVKALAEDDLGEWSYSLHDVVADHGEFDGKQVRFLRKINVHEVSPVLKGAGIGTTTLAVKAEGMKLSDHIAWFIDGAGDLEERIAGVGTLRAEKGKPLTPEHRDALKSIVEKAQTLLETDDAQASDEADDVTPELLRAVASKYRKDEA